MNSHRIEGATARYDVTDVAGRISQIVDRRRSRLPDVQAAIARWRQLDDEVARLGTTVSELRGYPRSPAELKDGLADFHVQDLRKGIAEALEVLRVLESRYSRATLNLGVSGRARVGKSTLLQNIAGLGEGQIPTGSGLPVTAVRSRIFHSTAHQRATLLLHSFESFRDEVLLPYHDELGLPGAPASLDEFRAWRYPRDESGLPPAARDKHSAVTILRRLRDMQQACWSFEADLTGGERTVELAELRPYVAYPTNEDSKADRCPRRYLAVRDVRIECRFPHAQVDHLGIIDLPGLGELAANAEKLHLRGLQDEVDVALLVKRPVEGMAYWGREDGQTANLLDEARGFIKNRKDFVFVVLNSGGADPRLTESLRDDIRRQVNDGVDDKHFRILDADAASQQSVYDAVLLPVLLHLAERLPVMDQEVFEGTRTRHAATIARIRSSLADLEAVLTLTSHSGASTAEDVEHRTVELRKDLAGGLALLVDRLRLRARSGDEDTEYLAAVEAAHRDVCAWISGGFGVGKEVWISNALRTMRVDRNSSPFVAGELNRIRVEISKRYASLDAFFRGRVERLWADVAALIVGHLGELLTGAEGEQALRRMAGLLSDASEPCGALSEATRDLLALRVEYRTHLHPRVRRELDGLNLQITAPDTGEPHDQIVVEISDAGAEKLFRVVTRLAEQAAYYTRKALVPEAATPALILHAAAEQFEDTLIRSGDSEREFRRLARSYRDEIWPGVFRGIDEANARVARLVRAIRAVREQLAAIEKGNA